MTTRFVEQVGGGRPPDPAWSDERIAREAARLEHLSPEERLAEAVAWFGEELLFTSSFGADAAYLLHLWSRVAPERPVVFVDTGFLHDETLAHRDALVARLGLRVDVVRPALPRREFLDRHGHDVPWRDPDLCCGANKIAPIAPHVARARGWVSGLRRDHGETRRAVPILERSREGPVKVYPLATETDEDVRRWIAAHGLPEHPLRARRYLSIGCEPCTRPVEEGEGLRAGRWAGQGKTECGLHPERGR